jgi:ABC-2 type transport system ATP-binding protein
MSTGKQNSQEIAIKVDGVSKSFKLPHEKHTSIKSAALNSFRRKDYEKQEALKNINFEVKKGEFFGIVGRNGSGKSTLLKCMAGVYTPDTGEIKIKGTLVPFIELGVGFNQELSGRDNVYLNGALLGFSRDEMSALYDDIVEFAELEQFMDQKLKNYSSGMQVRLAFSIAIQAKGDILLLDEVLAVGDAAFQKKCNDYFEDLKNEGKTVLLVTHNMDAVKKYCSKALILEEGQIKTIGSPDEVANQYSLDNMTKASQATPNKKNKHLDEQIDMLDIIPKSPMIVSQAEGFVFDVKYKTNTNTPVYIGISVLFQNVSLIEHNTFEEKVTKTPGVTHTFRYKIPLTSMNTGRQFQVSAAIFDANDRKLLGFNTDSCTFEVKSGEIRSGGLLKQKGEWTIIGADNA